MSNTIFQLLYSSQAVDGVERTDLDDILKVARETNKRLGISGLLLYENRQFMQVLEGDRKNVEELYAAIARDRRHKNVTLIYTIPETERQFTGWAMGHYDFGPDDEELMRSFVQICDRGDAQAEPDSSYLDDDQAAAFITAFRDLLDARYG